MFPCPNGGCTKVFQYHSSLEKHLSLETDTVGSYKTGLQVALRRGNQVYSLCYICSAFSKRSVGAGHSEEGGSQGGEGTLPSAHRACTFRGVWAYSPSEIILKFGCSKVPFCAVWGNLKHQNNYCISLFSSFNVMRFATKIRKRTVLSFILI